MIITVIGAECTGKTTLVRFLAGHYGVPWVPEAARVFVERERRPARRTDVEAIAALHRALVSGAPNGPFIFCDTDLLSTVAYARHYFGSCPRALSRMALGRPADLYLVAADDLPWVAESDQRGTEDDRALVQNRIRKLVKRSGSPWAEVRGQGQGRQEAAVRAIDRFLGRS